MTFELIMFSSFFRKLSIGCKIRDGLLMGTAEDVIAKSKNTFDLQDENELKDSIYGEWNQMSWKLNVDDKNFNWKGYVADLLRTIKDPEKPQTLEQLNVVYEDCIEVQQINPQGVVLIRVEFNPTVPHCSLATLIGLCIRVKLERNLVAMFKLDIFIKEGAHSTEEES